jgi:hypothetical protein
VLAANTHTVVGSAKHESNTAPIKDESRATPGNQQPENQPVQPKPAPVQQHKPDSVTPTTPDLQPDIEEMQRLLRQVGSDKPPLV